MARARRPGPLVAGARPTETPPRSAPPSRRATVSGSPTPTQRHAN